MIVLTLLLSGLITLPSVIMPHVYFNEEQCLNKCRLCRAVSIGGYFRWRSTESTVGDGGRVHPSGSGTARRSSKASPALPAEMARLCENDGWRQRPPRPDCVLLVSACVLYTYCYNVQDVIYVYVYTIETFMSVYMLAVSALLSERTDGMWR